MLISQGRSKYQLGNGNNVKGEGLSLNHDELDTALQGPIYKIITDYEGVRNLQQFLDSIPDTDFDNSEVKRVLTNRSSLEDWRVGEALAECYLAGIKDCVFPWPDGRDERISGSSLPGADLVGFCSHNSVMRFTFGEVKTSSHDQYPPSSMHGRSGLKQQIEKLKDNLSSRDDLVKYLMHRAIYAPWKNKFIEAYKNYNKDNESVKIFGILVRDVEPNKSDIQHRVNILESNCPPTMTIELLVIYLPPHSIKTLSSRIRQIAEHTN